MTQVQATDIVSRGGSRRGRHRGAQLRADAALDTSYEYSDFVDASGYSKIAAFFETTKGSCTSLEYKFQTSRDGTTWYDWIIETPSAGSDSISLFEATHTLSGDDNFFHQIDFFGRYFRVGVKCTGTKTGASVAVYVEMRD